MRIELHNTWSVVTDGTQEERDWLWNYLVLRTPKFIRDYTGRPKYDGERFEHFFDFETCEFPAGFTTMVERKARAEGVDLTVADARKVPAVPDWSADLAWLYDYQREAAEVLVARVRGLLQMGTGGGKTEVIAALLRIFPAMRFLIVVHRKGLMRQIGARIQLRAELHGHRPEDIGYFGDGDKELGHRITIATIDSLAANLKNPAVKRQLESAEALIVDEAHTAAADRFVRVLQRAVNAYYRWGVSGTPLARGDKRSSVAVGLLGPVAYLVPAEELIQRGFLARSRVHMVRHDAEEVYSSLWNVIRERGIVQSVGRNRAVLRAVQRAKKPAMVFVDLLEHGEFLLKGIRRMGINAEFVFGASATKERERALQRLVRGEIDVLVTSQIFNEGIDVPSLESVVLAAGGKSVIALLQRIGRGMRRVAGAKDTFEVWDFEDTHNRILENHYRDRKRAYKKEGHAIVTETSSLALEASEPSY